MWGIFFYKFWFQTVIYWKKVCQGWEIIFKNLFIILLELLTWKTDGQEKTQFLLQAEVNKIVVYPFSTRNNIY